ncbi:MAG: ATP-binding protein [Verrucomicrobiota bacterium JB022]|nr:ATP-binding protein [Verrucomicrobiota bacterium JB022]
MSITLETGVLKEPERVVIYGPEGCGKTTLASQFPRPVFIDTEGSTRHIDVPRFRPKTWDDLMAGIWQIRGMPQFQSVIVDTVDWAERLLTEHVCKKANKDGIEDFGYGKGYVIVAEEWRKFLLNLDLLRDEGLNVVLVAHSEIKKFEQPDQSGAYDRWKLKLSKNVEPLTKEWCDMLLFINYYTSVQQDKGTNKAKAKGGKERVIYSEHAASWDAKNRHSLPEQMPLAWESLAHLFPNTEEQQPKTAPAPKHEPSGKPATVYEKKEPTKPQAAPAPKPQPAAQEADDVPFDFPSDIAAAIEGHEDAVHAFLIKKDWLKEGQTYRDLTPSRIRQIKDRLPQFCTACGIPVPEEVTF